MPELALFHSLAQASAPTATPEPAVNRPAPGVGPVPSAPVSGASGSTAAPGTAPVVDPKAQPASPWGSMMLIIPMLLIVYFVLFRGQNKTEKKRKAMIAELKKGDRIMTIGGMLAKVVSVDGDEVVLKIDEAANVKATYRKSSIQEVIDPEEKKS